MLLLQTDKKTLLAPLQAVTGIVERRHTLPILSNVLIESGEEGVTFTATDLEIQVSAKSEAMRAEQTFALTVSAKKLQDILRALPEEQKITLDWQESRLQVRAGKSRFTLQTLAAEDFPRQSPVETADTEFTLPQKQLRRLLYLAQYAMAQQDIRYYLNGMLLVVAADMLKVVSTDGHRLSYASMPRDEPQSGEDVEAILPRKTVLELLKILDDTEDRVAIRVGKNQADFRFGDIVLLSKVVDGKFPDYNRVIPTAHKNSFSIARTELLQAMQRAAILSNEKFRGVRLMLTRDNLRVICNNNEQEEAQEELEIAYDGEPLDIGFNVTYLLDVLSHLDAPEMRCSFGDASSSGLITIADDDSFKYVVMPMRI